MKSLGLLLLLLMGCAPASPSDGGSGGRGTGGQPTGSGGTSSGGAGVATGGAGTGGAPIGTGGASSGGSGGGGAALGGKTGGASSGGSAGIGTGGRGQESDGGPDATAAGGAAGGNAGIPDGGADSGATGGGLAFLPCPPTAVCKILPLGDSITYGSANADGGWRTELFRQTLINSKKITFVGQLAAGPANVTGGTTTAPFPRNHEGRSAHTIAQVSTPAIIDTSLMRFQPHIVLVLIGTNDLNKPDLPNAPTRLGNLVDRITMMAPQALVVLATITPTKTDALNDSVKGYNDAMPALVASRVAMGKHIILVDINAAFLANPSYKTALLVDNLHPNPAGYVIMGKVWYEAIKGYLP